MIRLTVPGNPIPWERARSKAGQHFTAPRSRQHKAKIQTVAKGNRVRPLDGPIKLSATFYRDSAQPCDIDNLAKAVQDALNGIAYGDDRQIVTLVATKVIDRERPRTEIEVQRLPETDGGGVWGACEDHEGGCRGNCCHVAGKVPGEPA